MKSLQCLLRILDYPEGSGEFLFTIHWEDKQGHGFDESDLSFKRMALAVCGGWGAIKSMWVCYNIGSI